jgi:hypothetical protein
MSLVWPDQSSQPCRSQVLSCPELVSPIKVQKRLHKFKGNKNNYNT